MAHDQETVGFITSYGSHDVEEVFGSFARVYLVSGAEMEWIDLAGDYEEFVFRPHADFQAVLSWSPSRKVWDLEFRTPRKRPPRVSRFGPALSERPYYIHEDHAIEESGGKGAWKKALESANLLVLKFALKGLPMKLWADVQTERQQSVPGPNYDEESGTDW